MTSKLKVLFSFPDHVNQTEGKFFLWDEEKVIEVSPAELGEEQYLLTWEYEAVATTLVNMSLALPNQVVEFEQLVIVASKNSNVRQIRENFSSDLYKILERFGCSQYHLDIYRSLKCDSSSFPKKTLEVVGQALFKAFRIFERLLRIRGEAKRFFEVEIPVSNYLYNNICQGIQFNPEKIANYREEANHEYYLALKKFCSKHEMPMRPPTDKDLEAIFAKSHIDLENVSIDYLLEYSTRDDDFAHEAKELRRLKATRNALDAVSHTHNVCYPTVLVQGTRTSRISVSNPSLQNISRRYRDIFSPKNGGVFSYIDYDQFEVGIMAALSEDPILLDLYKSEDLYAVVSHEIFGDAEGRSRKHAKRLFLSYAYGMKRGNLLNAAVSKGANRQRTMEVFDQFTVFEKWKREIGQELIQKRRVGTELGNYYYIQKKGMPKAKQLRSAVSQKVQGTGSLIFKNALIKMENFGQFRLVLPMHDAVLVEHACGEDPQDIIDAMQNAMSEQFNGSIIGKASISAFSDE